VFCEFPGVAVGIVTKIKTLLVENLGVIEAAKPVVTKDVLVVVTCVEVVEFTTCKICPADA
jgi:hypothetical protein